MEDDGQPRILRLEESVVNRIAAGEVIQRPASALKELLENSLDAGSTSVSVLVKQGGTKLMQITDNGHGIRPADLAIVCERFTTSKLRKFDDLSTIATFGFRGEALASITHVAHVSVTSMTEGAPCALRCHYSDGKPVAAKLGGDATPKRCAGVRGTQICVEDLFYNMPLRQKGLRSAGEEYNRILDVMTRYAVHYAGVGFSCKKFGEHTAAVHTVPSASSRENIGVLYGHDVSRELLDFECSAAEGDRCSFEASGFITNANYSTKRGVFILFVNSRLVESADMRKAIDGVFSSYLPKGSKSFVYLSLEIPPENVDVNVHPTKREVRFLEEALVIERIAKGVEEKLLNSNASRVFYTQTLLAPGADQQIGLSQPAEEPEPAGGVKKGGRKKRSQDDRVYKNPSKMVRTDAKQSAGAIDAFVTRGKGSQSADSDGAGASSQASSSSGGGGGSSSQGVELSQTAEGPLMKPRKLQPVKLTSVFNLLAEVKRQTHEGLQNVLQNHVLVGMVNSTFSLLQHDTKLYLINTPKMAEALCYQETLRRFGTLGKITIEPPLPLIELLREGLRRAKQGPEAAEELAELLLEKSQMLEDYFSLRIQQQGSEPVTLASIPIVVDKLSPDMSYLPRFLVQLALHVDWNAEQSCFRGVAAQLAEFYSHVGPPEPDAGGSAGGSGASSQAAPSHAAAAAAAPGSSPEWVTRHVMFPAMRMFLAPSQKLVTDGTVIQIASLESLYRVFERC